jgi:hypothetical protein
MAVLQFRDDDVRRCCCDLAHMRRRFGGETSRQISHRLQQLEALVAIDDLEFLPFDSHRVDGGIEVTVNTNLSLLLEVSESTTGELHAMISIVIRSVRTTSPLKAK